MLIEKMASAISTQFIEQALSSQTPFPLSYGDPNQKWLIRTNLLSFFQDNPSFTPSFGTFFHDDGAAAHLLCATGHLRLSAGAGEPVPLTIWLHENHPFMPPIVIVSPPSAAASIRPGHPFVSESGRATCPYLETWSHPRCSLSNLARNLSRLFSIDHPLSPSSSAAAAGGSGHPSLMTKREALDRLAATVHYELAALSAGVEEEVAALTGLRGKAAERSRRLERAVAELEEERRELKSAGARLAEQSDAVVSFLRVNERERIEAELDGERVVESAFEIGRRGGGGGRSSEKAVVECLAADRGVEDVMYALDAAVKEGVVSIDSYLKQVRLLSREQFLHRALLVKLRGSSVLRLSYYS